MQKMLPFTDLHMCHIKLLILFDFDISQTVHTLTWLPVGISLIKNWPRMHPNIDPVNNHTYQYMVSLADWQFLTHQTIFDVYIINI